MIKSIKDKPNIIEIDLTGPQGNAYFLLGQAQWWAKSLDMDWPAIEADMKSSDYEHLLEVFEKEFGDFCILYR